MQPQRYAQASASIRRISIQFDTVEVLLKESNSVVGGLGTRGDFKRGNATINLSPI
jgi:hypothetical protein